LSGGRGRRGIIGENQQILIKDKNKKSK